MVCLRGNSQMKMQGLGELQDPNSYLFEGWGEEVRPGEDVTEVRGQSRGQRHIGDRRRDLSSPTEGRKKKKKK
ncbi:uncharacterized protein HKW66_Vig0178880 [Vigna angularis]|uniref:Uncharacterized protein n=1 Tax=Phaseolus angularis TaxID=3914 RepID=A0A8T0K223_PHAAN|nr:uncharacterized protein HKW66_Vig0178880 [Vigna angularis]